MENNSNQLVDALVAPIALYPDALIAQVLGAATYLDQVVEAENAKLELALLEIGALKCLFSVVKSKIASSNLFPVPEQLSAPDAQQDAPTIYQ